jgi:hypothetical protein
VRIRRGFLFWGIFFILLGAIPFAARLGWIDTARLTDLTQLWPIVLIAIGLAILLARSRAGAAGLIIAAVVLGAVGGLALAAGNGAILGLGDCSAGNNSDLQRDTQSGAFSQPATVSIQSNCGTLALATQPSQEWSLQAAYRGDPPVIVASASSLSIQSPSGGLRHQQWTLAAPAELTRNVDVHANAGTASLDLGGANLAELTVQGNAADVLINAPDGSIADLRVSMNAGRARLTLGGSTVGALSVNAGAIDLCVPSTAELQLDVPDHFAFDTNLGGAGLTRSGTTWQRGGSGGPSIHLRIDGNVGNFTLNPAGGCR